MIRLIAAIDEKRGVADEHGIPWQGKIPTDTNRFHDLTSDGLIVMGYATYKEFEKPLHDRENFVVAHPGSGELRPGFELVPNAQTFFNQHSGELVWVIGGAGLFEDSLARADQLFLTQLDADFHCTKFFPEFDAEFELDARDGPHVESDITFRFENWRRSPQD